MLPQDRGIAQWAAGTGFRRVGRDGPQKGASAVVFRTVILDTSWGHKTPHLPIFTTLTPEFVIFCCRRDKKTSLFSPEWKTCLDVLLGFWDTPAPDAGRHSGQGRRKTIA
jgi:hypothetical protein